MAEIFSICAIYLNMNEFGKSAASSLLASAIVYPLDVIKTKVQMNKNVTLSTPFRGFGVQMLSYPTFWTVFFTARAATLDFATYIGCPTLVHTFACSALGITAANPAFVIKTRMQLADNCTMNTMAHFRNLWRSRELMRGLAAAQVNSCKMTVQIPLYELLTSYNFDGISKVNSIIGASVAAKVVSSAVFYPTDLIRTTQRSSEYAKLTIYETIQHLTKPENGGRVFGLYRGVCVSTAATLPNFVLVMFFKDYLFV